MIPFPFEAFQQTYHGAFPDIVISFPGQPLRKSVWKDIAALVSIRSFFFFFFFLILVYFPRGPGPMVDNRYNAVSHRFDTGEG